MSKVVVRAISPGRWSIGPSQNGAELKLVKDVPGYEGNHPGQAVPFLKELIGDSGNPVPDRMKFFPVSMTGFGAPHDWIQAEFPHKLRPGETSAGRRSGLEAIAEYFAVA